MAFIAHRLQGWGVRDRVVRTSRTVGAAVSGQWFIPAVTVVTWGLLFAGQTPILPALCGGDAHDWTSVPARLDGMMRLTSPTGMLVSWGLMLVAMMLPLLQRPLAGIGNRAAGTGFVLAYAIVWMPAIAAISMASIIVALATQATPVAGAVIVAGVALAWQGSGTRAKCLCRCHDAGSVGGLADGAAFAFACVGTCWALMLLPNLAGPAHVPAMLAVTILLVHERGKDPQPGRRAMLMACGIVLAGIGLCLSWSGRIDFDGRIGGPS